MAVAGLLASGRLSSRALTEALLERIAAVDGDLHAFDRVFACAALTQAERADRDVAAGRYLGPLQGVPLAIKDLCWMRGEATAGGTLAYRDDVATEDATIVRRLVQAGAVLIGKTRLTEGAHADYHPSVEPVRNPWHQDYWAGISSSGSAVATAAGLCLGAIATDTGGSIRWPAAANGVTGIKPTWGRVSRHGVMALAPSLDHVGAIAPCAADAAVILAAIAGVDPADPTAAQQPLPAHLAAPEASVAGLRLGLDPRWNGEGVDEQTRAALDAALRVFVDLGARPVTLDFPDVARIVEDWGPACAVEAAVVHEARHAAQPDRFGPGLTAVIEAGRAVSATAYQRILLRRAAFRGRVDALFGSVDLILTPVQPFDPLTLARIATLGEQPRLIADLQRYTCPFNASGHPTLTLPAGFSVEGLPIGLQLVAGPFAEARLLGAGMAFQAVTSWHGRRPPLPRPMPSRPMPSHPAQMQPTQMQPTPSRTR